MPFDAIIMSMAVLAVFLAFAAVLAWADAQTRPSQRRDETSEAYASQLKRRSF
jgi:hypothetical protein